MFKVDENLPVEVADVLRRHALDAATVRDQSLLGCPDDRLAAICSVEARVLITQDLDFVRGSFASAVRVAGLILLRPRRADRTSLMRLAEHLAPRLVQRSVAGAIWVVSESGVRVRESPTSR